MLLRKLLVFFAVACALGVPRVIHAQASGGRFATGRPLPKSAPAIDCYDTDCWNTRLTVALNLGIGTPTGFVGGVVEYDPVRWFGFAAGLGATAAGPQIMLAIRPKLPINAKVAAGLSLGWSGGALTQHTGQPLLSLGLDAIGDGERTVFDRHYKLAHWLNIDFGFEVRPVQSFVIRPYAGVAMLLNSTDFRCSNYATSDLSSDLEICEDPQDPEYPATEWYPFVGIELGVSFF